MRTIILSYVCGHSRAALLRSASDIETMRAQAAASRSKCPDCDDRPNRKEERAPLPVVGATWNMRDYAGQPRMTRGIQREFRGLGAPRCAGQPHVTGGAGIGNVVGVIGILAYVLLMIQLALQLFD